MDAKTHARSAPEGARRGEKLNRLQRHLPEGLVIDAGTLEKLGYPGALRRKYVAGGWLEQPVRGLYARPGRPLHWQAVVISMQRLLRLPVIVSGRTALELQGFGHQLALDGQRQIELRTESPLPAWVSRLPLPERLVVQSAARLFPGGGIANEVSSLPGGLARPLRVPGDGLRNLEWGQDGWPLLASGPERAILEVLDGLSSDADFEAADHLFEGLTTLSPRRLETLLRACSSVKVKRLFFWLADRHGHSWGRKLDPAYFDLGTGKRVIAKGGRLVSKFGITVPGSLHADR